MTGPLTTRAPKEKSFNAFGSVRLESGSAKQLPRYMAPTIGAVAKTREERERGRVDIKEHLRSGDRTDSKNRSLSNSSMRGMSRTLNPSSLSQWRPTSIRDKSLDKSFATPLATKEPTGWVELGDHRNDVKSTSMTRSTE